jgi:hypothetical protein
MALVWLDGFETYGPVGTSGTALENELIRRYPDVYMGGGTTPVTELVAGFNGGIALRQGRSGNAYYLNVGFAPHATWVIGMAIKLPDDGMKLSRVFTVTSYNGTIQNSVWMREDLSLRAYRGSTSLLLGSGHTALKRNTWHYLEYKVYCHDSSGTIDVRLDGQTVISASGIDTLQDATGWVGTIAIEAPSSSTAGSVAATIDDLYILNGAAGLSDFLGPVKIETLRPTGDTATVDWTPSANADHYTLIDENPVNSSDYVASSTANQEDKYTLANLSSITTVQGVQLGVMAQLDGPGSKQLYLTCDSNGSVNNGSEIYLAGPETVHFSRILETDPDTSNAWTTSAIDALIAGIRVN